MVSIDRDSTRTNDGPLSVCRSLFGVYGAVGIDPAVQALRDLILLHRVPAGERHIETLPDPHEDSFGFDLPWIQTHEEAAAAHLREAAFPVAPNEVAR